MTIASYLRTRVMNAPGQEKAKEGREEEILTPHHDRLSIERSLFGHFLEKGVIRSGRAFAALYANEVADDDASVVCHELLSTELPLTT